MSVQVVVIVGNGLSIAANPALALERLSARFLEQHREDPSLVRLLEQMGVTTDDASVTSSASSE
jgi:hypothetical protein